MDDLSPEPAIVVVNGEQQQQPPFKRNRQAPAKTFQCRGYGECRMVFSRSEHLARHIRYTSILFRSYLANIFLGNIQANVLSLVTVQNSSRVWTTCANMLRRFTLINKS